MLGLAKTSEQSNISEQSSSNTQPWPLLFILLAIVVGLGWLNVRPLEENREPNSSANEVEQEEEDEHSGGESSSSHYFDGDQQLVRWRTAEPGGGSAGRRSVCIICGNLSNTRCSRCKVARYCSMNCQISHWRSGHQYECYETENEEHQARQVHDHGSMLVQKPERESNSNPSQGEDVVESSDVSSSSDVNNSDDCQVCGSPSTTRCSRCKAVKYCSTTCLINDWRWHKGDCIAVDVNSAPPAETPNRTNTERYFEEEATKSRNEISLLRSECDRWKNRANFARERFQSFKNESEHQIFVLENEKESMLKAEKKACNVIHSLHEKLDHIQNKMQENIAEKIKLEEHIQILESECAKLRTKLKEEHKYAQGLKVQSSKSHEAARIAIREAEAVRQELQDERKRVLQLEENFLRDVAFAESRAAFAEAKLNDLRKKIRLTDYKVPIVIDSLGRPVMACTICLSNEQDMAFGCGHMTCRDCGSKLSKCPICREQITNHIRLFPS